MSTHGLAGIIDCAGRMFAAARCRVPSRSIGRPRRRNNPECGRWNLGEALECRTLLTNTITLYTQPPYDSTPENTNGQSIYAAFFVERTGDLTSAETVNFSLSGTATLGTTPSPADDYSVPGTTLNSPASTRSVTIPLGYSYAIFNVYPISDVWFEGN